MSTDAGHGPTAVGVPLMHEQLIAMLPVSVRVIDRAACIVQSSAIARRAHAVPLHTLRELWERDEPRDPVSGALVSYLDVPAVRALSGEQVHGVRLLVQRDAWPAESASQVTARVTRLVEMSATPLLGETGEVTGVLLVEAELPTVRPPEIADDVTRAATGAQALVVNAESSPAGSARDEAAPHDPESERRLTAIATLAAAMVHDLNNALNPIVAAAFLLRHHAASPDLVRDYADRISNAAEAAATTAARVGRFVRQTPVHAGGDESIDLNALVSDVLDESEAAWSQARGATRAIRVVRSLGASVRTRGLPDELRSAVLSLLANAREAMPEGGTLTVRSFTDGSDVCVAVQDDGVGMSPDVQARAFEPFFTTRGVGGLGLGLAEVYGILRRHGGTVTLQTTPGVGTTVTVRLPREPVTEVGLNATPADQVPRSGPIRVLVVEDHEDGRHFLRRILESKGHRVDAVGTSAEARERLAAHDALSFDLLLTDVGLPDGSGWDVVTFAKSHVPGIRVGVITGWETQRSANDAVGAEFVLQKPLRAKELLAHIAGESSPAQPE